MGGDNIHKSHLYKKMKIIQIHNKYRYFGGEDSVVEEEARLLRSNNHEVIQLIRNNSEELTSFNNKLKTFKNISYSNESIEILNEKVSKFGLPDIVHIHNTFPLWTYSVLDFFKKKNVPIIMTLHNYRLIWEKLGYLTRIEKNMDISKTQILALLLFLNL